MKKILKSKSHNRKGYSFLEEINKVVTDYLHALQVVNNPIKQPAPANKSYK